MFVCQARGGATGDWCSRDGCLPFLPIVFSCFLAFLWFVFTSIFLPFSFALLRQKQPPCFLICSLSLLFPLFGRSSSLVFPFCFSPLVRLFSFPWCLLCFLLSFSPCSFVSSVSLRRNQGTNVCSFSFPLVFPGPVVPRPSRFCPCFFSLLRLLPLFQSKSLPVFLSLFFLSLPFFTLVLSLPSSRFFFWFYPLLECHAVPCSLF